jgi:predicted HTH transcriptional regulator
VVSEVIYEKNRPIIAVNIKKGIKPLYCIKKYGFSSKGCLVRIGPTCKEMSSEEIQFRYKSQFINEDYMLIAPSKYAPLSFNMMKILLASRGFHINENSFEATFNLKRNDGTYNLLAEILADQNMLPLIFVKFVGVNKASISHRSDYGGQSLLLGYQKMKDRLIAENICKTDTTVRPRIDEYLYDINCANEALVNMLVHNDWTITEPQVSFYSDRIVFTSHGGIPHGMTEEDFYSGVSRPRNAVLMRVFLNLGIVEHTGHGIPMIVEKYGRKAFDIHQNYIDVTLPFNQAVLASVPQLGTDEGTDDEGIRLNEDLSNTEKKVILELIKDPGNTYNQLASEIGCSRRTVSRAVASLVEKKYIKRIGNNKSGFWKIVR